MDASGVLELRRQPEGSLAGGVCTAVSERCGVDVLLVRLVVVLLALSGGMGAVGYLWAWLVLPRAGDRESLLHRWVPESDGWSATHLVAVGMVVALLCAGLLGAALPWGFGPAMVLAAAVLLARRSSARRLTGGGTSPRPSAAPGLGATVGDGQAPAQQRPVVVGFPSGASPARAPRPRASWTWGLAVLLAAGTVDVLVRHALAWKDPALAGNAAALVVLGLAILLGALTRLPRPRLAGVASVLLALAVLSSMVLGPSLNARTMTKSYTSVAQFPSGEQRLNASAVTYDLTAVPTSSTGTLRVQANASRVVFVLPKDAAVRVDYTLLGSDLVVGDEQAPERISGEQTGHWPTITTVLTRGLVLQVDARASTVVVRHAR